MNKLGQYNNDERGNYSFGYYTEDGKHVNISFRAEPDYDLDIVFNEFRNFLIASGHDIEGQIGELGIDDGSYDDSDYANEVIQSWANDSDEGTQTHKDNFSMDHLPNNGWPFGGLTPASIPSLDELPWPATFVPAIRSEKRTITAIALVILLLLLKAS